MNIMFQIQVRAYYSGSSGIFIRKATNLANRVIRVHISGISYENSLGILFLLRTYHASIKFPHIQRTQRKILGTIKYLFEHLAVLLWKTHCQIFTNNFGMQLAPHDRIHCFQRASLTNDMSTFGALRIIILSPFWWYCRLHQNNRKLVRRSKN